MRQTALRREAMRETTLRRDAMRQTALRRKGDAVDRAAPEGRCGRPRCAARAMQ
jgi:hypothetical protein